ncbi:MAG TPA: carboxypeptidase-like regulatory domain-containing protein [Nitrosospira sp.]|nr:carboxypeptidase-like regulatory domain-containing protein [Nitrosospira sp.]
MRATIQFSHPDKKLAILQKLLTVVKGIKNLRQHILAHGILLERLSESEIEKLKETLAESNNFKCIIAGNSARVIIIDGELRVLFGLVIPIPRQSDFARIFWERGFTLEEVSSDQAESLKDQLDAIATVTVSPDIAQIRIYTVSGQVCQDDGAPLTARGFTVRAFDSLPARGLLPCGSAAALQPDGSYRVDYAWRSNGRKGPDLVVRVFDAERSVVAESRKPSAAIQEFLDITVEALCIVRGRTRYPDGAPLPNVIVRAFDRDLRSEILLGQTVTDADGFYEIPYNTGQFSTKKARADLIIRVFEPDSRMEGQGAEGGADGGEEIAVSDIVFNAPLQQAIDLEIAPSKFLGPSEYERHMDELKPLIGNEPAQELTDEDLNFLNGKTSISFEQLHYVRLDAQWSFQYELEPAVAYGFFRQGLPTELDHLLTEKSSRLRNALEASLAQNIIPAVISGQIDQSIDQLLSLVDSRVVELDRKAR